MSEDLKKLIAERGLVKSALTRFQSYVRTHATAASIDELQKRLDNNSNLLKRFEAIQNKIDLLATESEDEEQNAKERESFESSYYSLIVDVETRIKATRSPHSSPSRSEAIAGPSALVEIHPRIRLPQIDLPTFDGSYDKWVRFRATFESLIHKEDALSNMQKFHYLDSALKGDASRVIEGLGVSDSNYGLAWEALCSRYEDSRALVDHHVKALMTLPCLNRESHGLLLQLLDDTRNHVAALKSLGQPTEHWCTLLVYITANKLDGRTKREWEKHVANAKGELKFADMHEFLESHCRYLAKTAGQAQPFPGMAQNKAPPRNRMPTHAVTVTTTPSAACALCGGNHTLNDCRNFRNLTPSDRLAKVREFRACYNCLRPGHGNRACNQKACKRCHRKHHTLLHLEAPEESSTPPQVGEAQPESSSPQVHVLKTGREAVYTCLSTAVVAVKDRSGETRDCRVLLDQGSQVNLIRESFCKRIGLRYEHADMAVAGIGASNQVILGRVNLDIASRYNRYKATLPCLVIEKITGDIPDIAIDKSEIPIPPGYDLADPEFHRPREVDVLLGNGYLWDLICVGQHRLGKGYPLMQKTRLGWILAGRLYLPSPPKRIVPTVNVLTDEQLDVKLERFWTYEDIRRDVATPTDPCERHFCATTVRNQDGRFMVKIPFSDNIYNLGESRKMAERRLLAIERKLARDSALQNAYTDFMDEYETLGHMTRLDPEQAGRGTRAYYLPHLAVQKGSSTTTKVRVVFDGSAKTSTGLSLNDTQLVGPIVQSDLLAILLRFRKHAYVISADVAKMYRQVLVDPDQRRYQRILWRPRRAEPIRIYELNTVTYGTASASFLATRALKQLALDNEDRFPEACNAIKQDFYVDDLLTGTSSLEEAVRLRDQIGAILKTACFELRKWASNDARIVADGHGTERDLELAAEKDPKTLGLVWSTREDVLRFDVNLNPGARVTKRVILSQTARIFDPLGLIGPVVVKAKLILQELWQLRLSWDESVPQCLHSRWIEFQGQLAELRNLSIPRGVTLFHDGQFDLHGFCDASERAYGACVYLRSSREAGQCMVRLLCAKSRIAPLKTISLPRLELCAAVLLAQLMGNVRIALQLNIRSEHCWTDSQVTLAWIRASPSRWKTFVANRVTEIQDLSKGSWRHVPTAHNPADIISRGSVPAALSGDEQWWAGPSWLCSEEEHWPGSPPAVGEVPEMKAPICASVTVAPEHDIFARSSEWPRLARVTAYCLRLRSKARPRTLKLTLGEVRDAEEALIRVTQEATFAEERRLLKASRPLPHSSRLLQLHPFLDERGLIRVGGRLENAPVSYTKRHPVLLPSKHALTDMIVRHEHCRLLHAGPQAVLCSLRDRYWPLAGKSTVRRVVHACVRCFRANPRIGQPLMGNLPAGRVTPARPFSTCGVDYAGPFFIRPHARARAAVKTYLCVFVCFATKAVHLELAVDLSTQSFLNCFRRFIARRGLCRHIHSDNGTNFIGARGELDELGALIKSVGQDDTLGRMLQGGGIEWHLIPPHAPNFGGLWEAAVRSAKQHLRKVIGETRLTFEELYTIVTQVEACLNSRPLSPLSDDPTDLNPLTPGHFLIGESLSAIPDMDLREVPQNRLTRFQLCQQLFQHFWRRWHREYLHQLQQRPRRKAQGKSEAQIGSLVLIRDDNLPPMRWHLGRITQLHTGADQIARVATVRTKGGEIRRPITKLAILPIDPEEAEATEARKS